MRTHFKAWAEPFLKEHPEFVILPNMVESKMGKNLNVLEVGSGKGQLITRMAKNNPDNIYFAMERNVTCAGFLAKKIEKMHLKNCYIVYEDFEKAYIDLKKDSFDFVLLSFPDPWPKKRHEKRRLTCPRLVKMLASLVIKGGYLRLKTDNDDLFTFSVKTFKGEESLIEKEIVEDYKAYMPKDEMSEYEESFRSEGHLIHHLLFERR